MITGAIGSCPAPGCRNAPTALSLFTILGDADGRAEALFVLGTVELYAARYQEAAAFSTDSLKQHRDHGPEPITARDLGGLGTALLNLGDLPRARAVLYFSARADVAGERRCEIAGR